MRLSILATSALVLNSLLSINAFAKEYRNDYGYAILKNADGNRAGYYEKIVGIAHDIIPQFLHSDAHRISIVLDCGITIPLHYGFNSSKAADFERRLKYQKHEAIDVTPCLVETRKIQDSKTYVFTRRLDGCVYDPYSNKVKSPIIIPSLQGTYKEVNFGYEMNGPSFRRTEKRQKYYGGSGN